MTKRSDQPDLHQRYRDYLAQYKLGEDFTIDEKTWISVAHLKSVALGNGYILSEIARALEKLKNDVDVACLWDRESRVERICLYPMSDEERAKRKADLDWFDSLPG